MNYMGEKTKDELIEIIHKQRTTINLQTATIGKLQEIIKLLGDEK